MFTLKNSTCPNNGIILFNNKINFHDSLCIFADYITYDKIGINNFKITLNIDNLASLMLLSKCKKKTAKKA